MPANDIVLIAIIENNELKGFNIAIGGGLSFTHGNDNTYPRLATVIRFTDTEEKTLQTVYEILTVQRDFGNGSDRKQAWLKYTIDRRGVDEFKKEVEKRIGFELEDAKQFSFTQRKDDFGWHQSVDGLWHYTVFVECGRICDDENAASKTALYEIAQLKRSVFRFTCNQNMIVADVKEEDKNTVDSILGAFRVKTFTENASAIRLSSLACVAFNTCPLALAQAQRYIPTLISKMEPLLTKRGLSNDDIILRMTGCPNGCGRSMAAEIGLIGTAYGLNNLHIGGDRVGLSLNKKYKENLNEEQLLKTFDTLLEIYVKEKEEKETLVILPITNG